MTIARGHQWTTADYDRLSWHDNYVHALRLVEGEDGTGELSLDIDHIIEWLGPNDGSFSFLIAPAVLRFHDVCDLRIMLDYRSSSMAMGPFAMLALHREPKIYPNGYRSYQWRIEVVLNDGAVDFVSSGFTMQLMADPRESASRCLPADQRAPA